MASPVSPAQAFHNRFNTPATSAATTTTAPSSTDGARARLSSNDYSYPDLDAGQYHSSAALHTGGTAATAPLPSFPEFNSFDFESEFSSARHANGNDFFSRFGPNPSAATAAPTSAGSPTASAADSQSQQRVGDQPTRPNRSSDRPRQPADAHAEQAAALAQLGQTQLERGFSSASMYQSPSTSTRTSLPPVSVNADQQSAPGSAGRPSSSHRPSADVQSIHSSSQSHNGSPGAFATPLASRPASPQKAGIGSNFTFPAATAAAAVTAPAVSAASDGPDAREALRLNELSINDESPIGQQDLPQHPSAAQQQPPQQPRPQQQQVQPQSPQQPQAERPGTSGFFGMERPLAAVNASGQHVPVPRGMTPGDEDDPLVPNASGQSHQHSSGLPSATSPMSQISPQMRQPTQNAGGNGPQPSSFFGVEGSASDAVTPPALPEDDGSLRGQPHSQHRSEGSYRGISTAAGGTGNGPMPSSVSGGNGYGGLGPSGATRPASIAPTINNGPLLDHSHLKVGQKASLLSHGKTLELYRQNAKKTNDPNLIYELAVFMIDASKSMGNGADEAANSPSGNDEASNTAKDELVKEATGLLKKIADRGHPDAQYFLADCYANGIGTAKGKQDFSQAYTYFVLAAKHGHPDAAYRAGTCYEKGWGCRKDNGKALQFYRKAAAQNHPGAMYRLATAELNGELGLRKSAKEGVKWLKRSAEAATPEFPHALHELALLHERGIDNVLFVDPEYSCELLAQAGEMGYAPSAYKLGVNYEYGRMGCPQDGGLSIHMYNIAAQQNHKEACFALTAWYLVGAPGILPQSDTEAYLWAKKAAEQGLAKAEYAVGYFTEMGIGTVKDLAEAKAWYKLAAEHGDKRANQRLVALGGRSSRTLAGVGAGGGPAQNGRTAGKSMPTDYGRRGQPTSAPFPSNVDRHSMAPSTQMSYPTPIAMREAQTAQREQQYLANVAATERAQAQARAAASMRSGPPSAVGSPPPSMASPHAKQGRPFSQAYPSYPASASAPLPQPPAFAGQPHTLSTGSEQQRPGMASPTPPGDGDDAKKKKKWFGRS